MHSKGSTARAHLSHADLAWLGRVARALLRDEAGADDLVQDTVVAALEAPLEAPRSQRGWLRAVAIRLAARRHRDEIRRRDRERSRALEDGAVAADELVAAAEAAERVAGAARRLEEPFRRAILEHYLEELSASEIAARSGAKVDTVRWRLRRGLELMREDLERADADRPESGPWARALLPLTVLPSGTASSSAPLTALASALLLTMKPLYVAMAALLCAFGFFVLRTAETPEASSAAPVIERETAQLEPPIEAEPGDMAPRLERVAAAVTPLVADPGEVTGPPATRLEGRVIDERRRGIEGAAVFLMDPRADDVDGAALPPRVTTRRNGQFTMTGKDIERWLERHDDEVRISAIANGYLRSEGLPIERGALQEALEIVLDPGYSIEGRVEDELGAPVQGLELFAHSPFVNSDALSATRVLMNGSRRHFSPPLDWPYSQCEGRTDAGGYVSFSGLEEGPCTVRSLDPCWEIVGSAEVEAGSRGVVWRAVRRFGIRLVATRGGVPLRKESPRVQLDVAKMSSNFQVELLTTDGAKTSAGRWFGAGNGEVSFTLAPREIPTVKYGQVDRFRFYGSATLQGESVEWSSPRWLREDLESGMKVVAVEFPKLRPDGAPEEGGPDGLGPKAARKARVELDVRYLGSGAPFDGDLSVDWRLLSDGSNGTSGEDSMLSGSVRGKRLPSGRYGVSVPAGDVLFEVQPAHASGSQRPWSGRALCATEETTVVSVELREGATALIQRPLEWSGEWFVRASFRTPSEEGWFGSWNYSTAGEELRLTGLVPAEWRFELRPRRTTAEPPEVRTVVLLRGDVFEVR